MVLINDTWLSVRDLDDVVSIVREYYNSDLADIIEKLIPEHTDEEYNNLNYNLEDSENTVCSLEDDLDTAEFHNEILEEKVEALEEEIKNLKKQLENI